MDAQGKMIYILKETNSWWKSGAYRVDKYFPRSVFSDIERFLKLRQIIALVGLRRTGKTTLMFKIIEQYIERIPPENILYFSFDDFASIDIEDIIDSYNVIFPDMDLKKGRFLFCFDEIQKLVDWQDKIKRLYDMYPNIKIVVSGSESLFIRKGIKETLGGRIFEFRVAALSFKEYLSFVSCEKYIEKPNLYGKEIVLAYRKFMKISGFPELVGIDDDMVIHKYVKETIIDKILFKDIPQIFGVRNPDVIGEILDLIIYSPGQIIDATKLAKEMALSRQVVSLYLDYLEKAFLVKKLYNFSRNLRKQKRSMKKYYPAITFPVVMENNFSFCFECSLVWQLDAQFFYRDAYQNEVDTVLVGKNKSIIPIEIKTGNVDTKSVKYFMKKFKTKDAFVLTLKDEAVSDGITVTPFYKYLFRA